MDLTHRKRFFGRDQFFGEDDTLARKASRFVFTIPALTIVSLVLALTVMRDNPVHAIIAALILMLISTGSGFFLERRSGKEFANRLEMVERARNAHRQIEELFAMTDMLQAADGHDDAGTVLMATAERLLPEYGGALYVFNNSRDRLDLAKSWNTNEGFSPSETLLSTNCWALKRGKPHINDPTSQTLCCLHQIGRAATIEVPMMARGRVFGLLILATEQECAFDRLTGIHWLARAIADSMSLALSNIALREKLRAQSLRDPLTGLYNRRYMEDALERYVSLAERSGNPTSVIMIDLDNFKRLNDENGHAKGDSVLRDVASQLVAALRSSDVVSRYGGEELMVIMPNCDLKNAELKAEMLRERIEALSEPHGFPITASFGIATVPETSTSPADLILVADAALYVAKRSGKNRIECAKRRAGREDIAPMLALS